MALKTIMAKPDERRTIIYVMDIFEETNIEPEEALKLMKVNLGNLNNTVFYSQ